jgi:uncharacterized protein YcbX
MAVSSDGAQLVGNVATLWRYPVKSMLGEEMNAAEVTARGLLGDRAYAVLDAAEGKVASAKNPRKWPRLFDFRAAFADTPRRAADLPPVRITLPDGEVITSEQSDLHQILSRVFNREVTFATATPSQRMAGRVSSPTTATAEAYWPDIEGLDNRDAVTEFALPEGTFFDAGVIHILTTATLERLRELYPAGRFEVRRFRPNIVVETDAGVKDFVENEWIGRTIAIGDTVRLSITRPCSRCVMTTLPQADLPRDNGILRAIAQHNRAQAGVYASVLRGGTIRRGDEIRLGPL